MSLNCNSVRCSWFFVPILCVLLASCGGNDKQITVEFRLVEGSTDYSIGSSIMKGDTAVAFDLFHFYVSDFRVDDEILSQVLFVNTTDSTQHHYSFEYSGRGSSLSFGLGVTPTLNATDPTTYSVTHPLSSAYAMYWTWASKYRFIKAEGRFNPSGILTDAATNSSIVWHTGTDALYQEKEFNASIRPGDHLIIELDVPMMLQGISLQQDRFTHSSVDNIDVAQKVTNLALQSFRLIVE